MSRVNPLRVLETLGQSIWLDDIRRAWLKDGTLARLIAEDAVSGITSNPAIFEKAIAQHNDYDAAIAAAVGRGLDTGAIYEELVIEDVQGAADLLRPLYERTQGANGYVSLEVSPHFAHNTEATILEAQRLWARMARPNLMIKVPATRAGLPAIRKLIALGMNVNITLLFSVARYREVTTAWMEGLEDRHSSGAPITGVASVASFFLSRIDTLVDGMLDRIDSAESCGLRGQAAVACARLAYQRYKTDTASQRWQALGAQGARPQRLLWASTSTKDATYSDVKYVEALIGLDTIDTLPPETLAAYRDHGEPALRLEQNLDATRALPAQLATLGVALEQVAEQLESEGVRKFVEPYDRLHLSLAQRVSELATKGQNHA